VYGQPQDEIERNIARAERLLQRQEVSFGYELTGEILAVVSQHDRRDSSILDLPA
jgi:hypothetical protein